ncbi:hypothetical protein FQN50_006362 [Emmonsiellopsis sp. PD_5]|nr:hypothetical protein FQN50_006362 [Emmonsiellopsis sp. PD_5]
MASLKRSKTMPADGQTAKFLYTILKQLDLKSIDWNLVASQLEITNGHAARMRFSRFRQHMEGITTTHRTPRPKKAKVDKTPSSKKQQQFKEPKREPPTKIEPKSEPEPMIKQEPGVGLQQSNVFKPMEMIPAGTPTGQPYSLTTVAPADLALPFQTTNQPVAYPISPMAAEWSRLKMEKCDDAAVVPDAFVKMEPNHGI